MFDAFSFVAIINPLQDSATILIATCLLLYSLQNLSAAFRSSPKFGPPDADERKKRRKYDETVNLRICRHACILLDVRIKTMSMLYTCIFL